MIAGDAAIRIRAAIGLTAGIALGMHPAVAQTARPELAQPRVVESSQARFEGRVVAREAMAEVGGFGAVRGVYPSGFSADATDPQSDLLPDVWSVQPGDLMTFELENRLPCSPDRSEGTYGVPMSETNIHTHGMIVSPNGALAGTYGDYVFVLADTGSGPGEAASDCTGVTSRHGHEKVRTIVPYAIEVPEDHPPGGYWFHPHAHGVSQQQIARGLASLITMGDIWDYARLECQLEGEGSDDVCTGEDATLREIALRDRTRTDFVVLKDIQVEPAEGGGWQAVKWYDPGFCGEDNDPVLTDGVCAGEDDPGSRWLVTVNGQVQPVLNMADDEPEILRLANLSASFVYNLKLTVDEPAHPVPDHRQRRRQRRTGRGQGG